MADSVSIKINKDLRPAYYDDFHCLAADCRFSCCKAWRIAFDKKDYLSLKRQKGTEDLNNRLEQGVRRLRDKESNYYGELDMSGGDCPLLREDGLCALQIEKDHAALPQVCRAFPRAMAYLPEYLERSLSPACEGVLELLWNLPDGVEFRSNPLPKKERGTLTVSGERPLVPFFQPIREWCIDILQDRRLPLPQRILLIGLALRELAEGEMDIPAWLTRARALPEAEELPGLPREDNALAMFLTSNLRTLNLLETTGVDYADKSGFQWIAMIRLPDFVTRENFAWAVSEAERKKKLDCSSAEFLTVEEGLCVQIMHLGPYDSEPETVAQMDAYLAEQGYENDLSETRRHHEIYLSDPRRAAPEKWKTVIRHPIKKR